MLGKIPNLPAYCFDIDGTLCTNTEGTYDQAQPYPDRIARVNTLYEAGHKIFLYTARGSTTGISWEKLTREQLKSWGVKYHEVYFGKPTANIYVDDKGISLKEWLDQPQEKVEQASR
jgi:hypothetical protein